MRLVQSDCGVHCVDRARWKVVLDRFVLTTERKAVGMFSRGGHSGHRDKGTLTVLWMGWEFVILMLLGVVVVCSEQNVQDRKM